MKNRLIPASVSLVCLSSLAVFGLGCGSDATQQAPTTQVDTSVWNSAVTTLVVADQGGGFAPQAPQGSKCVINAQKYTLTVATKGLAWTRCISSNSTTPYMEASGSRVLSDAELKDLGSVLGNLRVIKPTGGCIADASMLTVDVSNPYGSQQYVDDGFQCSVMDKPFIERGTIQSALDSCNKLAVPAS